jgi:glycerol uptake facilitator-like aquaporin
MTFPKPVVILAIFMLTLLINLPFGLARSKSRKFSLRWFLYIHIPIPLIFMARMITQTELKYIPVFAVAALLGQVLGGKLE